MAGFCARQSALLSSASLDARFVKEGGDLLYGRLIYVRGVDLMDSLA